MSDKDEVPLESRESIMKATFKALCRHGYADVTMEKIAAESDKCKSTFHYHYGTKENLMVDFIKFLLEGFEEKIIPDTEDPVEKLNGLIDNMLFGLDDGDTHEKFHTALLELRSQAPYNAKYREQITKNDEFIRKVVKEIIEEGIEKGSFKESVDPDRTATIILSAIDGARARHISTDRDVSENVREALNIIIKNDLMGQWEDEQ
ncbi:MAG: TetR/AcrR family transcriptional regulator [Thermoplasmata archaeon]